MAAGTWKVYARAKKHIGAGNISLLGVIRMQLHRASASAELANLSALEGSPSVPAEISARGGYAALGRTLPSVSWTAGASAKQMRFSYASYGIIFTASGSALNDIKYALLRNSLSAGGGYALCYCTLSSSEFTIAAGNTLTIAPASTGVFTLT